MPIEEIQAAVDGAISPEQAAKLRQCLSHIDELEKHKAEIETEILRVIEPFFAVFDLIRTIPVLNKNPMTSVLILSEIGGDMSIFPTAKHLVSLGGCCPHSDRNAKNTKSTRISIASSYLKPLLAQVTNPLLKSKEHPEFKDRYSRIKVRRGHKNAIIAVCKMLLTAIWNLLSKLEVYTPDGYLQDRPIKESKVLSTSQALNLLRQCGYVIKDDPEAT